MVLLFFLMFTRFFSHSAAVASPPRRVNPIWSALEPNTGVMLIRHTDRGLRLMRTFLLKLVNEGKSNDQPFLNNRLGFVEYSTDCHYDYSRSYDENIAHGRQVAASYEHPVKVLLVRHLYSI